jgi:hypothetical protein
MGMIDRQGAVTTGPGKRLVGSHALSVAQGNVGILID